MPNDLSVWTMVLDASPIVQAVVALLMLASLASWAIIFRKSHVISRSRRGADHFEIAVLVRRGSGGSVSQHRDQGARRHRHAKHFRVRLRRVQPPAPAGHPGRSAARGRQARNARGADARARPPGAQSRHARHRGIHQSVRGAVRHGVGHHERLPQPGQRAAGDARGRGAGNRRSADHDGHRAVRGDSGGHCLQPLRRSGEPPGTSLRHVRRRVLHHPAAPRAGPCAVPRNSCLHHCVAAN